MRDRTLSPWGVTIWQKILSESLAASSFVDVIMANWAEIV